MNKPLTNNFQATVIDTHCHSNPAGDFFDEVETTLVRNPESLRASDSEIMHGVADLEKVFCVTTKFTNYVYPERSFQGPPEIRVNRETNISGVSETNARKTFEALRF